MTSIAILTVMTTLIPMNTLSRSVTTVTFIDRVFTSTIQTGTSLRSSRAMRTSLATGISIRRSSTPRSRRLVSYPLN